MIRAMTLGLLGALTFHARAAGAGEAVPFADFSAHFVKAPPRGQVGHITVQIDPVAQARRLAVRKPGAAPSGDAEAPSGSDEKAAVGTGAGAGAGSGAAAPARFAWFWDKVSPDLSARSPGRLDDAMRALSSAPDGQAVPTPRLADLRALAARYGRDMLRASVDTHVSPALALAVAAVESGGDPGARSPAGAQGVMQLVPATAARFGVGDVSDPAQNISGGIAYLDWLMGAFDNDPILVLAAYNAGENAVRAAGGVPDFPETRDYVPRVLAAWGVARSLCLTPPELISDGCVFNLQEAQDNG